MAKTHRFPEDQIHYVWDNELAPALTVEPGDTVVYHTRSFDLIKGRSIPAPQFQTPGPRTPMVEHMGWYATMGVHTDLMQAAKDSLRAMVEHISTTYGLESIEAYGPASLVVDLRISEIVNAPNWIVSSYLPLAIFD